MKTVVGMMVIRAATSIHSGIRKRPQSGQAQPTGNLLLQEEKKVLFPAGGTDSCILRERGGGGGVPDIG